MQNGLLLLFLEDSRLVELIEELGARTVITTPEKHDEAVALISHMPMVVAQAIFKTAAENPIARNCGIRFP